MALPVLSGLQTNLYMNFMERTWRSMRPAGVVGLLHPDGHLSDPKAGRFREASYRHLRRNWNFSNELQLFEEVDHHASFGVGIYRRQQKPSFLAAFNLLDPQTLDDSLCHDGSGDEPGIQYTDGGWDVTPHKSRIINVDIEVLSVSAALYDSLGTPPSQGRLFHLVTAGHLSILRHLAQEPTRMADIDYRWSGGWHEKGAKDKGCIVWRTADRSKWEELILQGPHISVATPMAKQPNNPCKNRNDYSEFAIEDLPESLIPRTNYQQACSDERYQKELKLWEGYSLHLVLSA